MHTAFLRANVVFFFSITVLFVLSLGCAAQYFTKPADFPCAITEAQVGRFRQFHRPAQYWEHAQGSFHLAADLRPVWNWNTGQLFVWVTVEWDGSARSNRVSVWDRIIRTKEEANLDETFDLEYMINDQHSELKGKELTVKLYYDVMPNVGILKTVAAPETCSTKMKMPRQYSS